MSQAALLASTALTAAHVIRPSSLTTWRDCNRRWFARHQADRIRAAGYSLTRTLPSSAGAVVGSGVHGGVHLLLAERPQKIATALDAGVAELERRIEEEGVLWDGPTPRLADAQIQVRRMVQVYALTIAPTVKPVMVEERMEADLPGGWVLSGSPDLMTEDPNWLRDCKTGTRQRANAIQYGAYTMLRRSHGGEVKAIAEDFIPRAPVRNPQPAPVFTPIDVTDAVHEAAAAIEDIQEAAKRFDRAVAEGKRPPHTVIAANPASALCSERWCVAWGTDWCKAHKREAA